MHKASFLMALMAIAHLFSANPAQACGGFFCNSSSPVNQAAERIIFSQDAEGNVTAAIEIQYQGPSEQFVWMLPVAGNPEISISSNSAFNALQLATNPTYTLNTRVVGECGDDFFRGGGGFDSGAPPSADAGIPEGPPPVTVVNQGAVGPYDFVIISVEAGTDDPGQFAVDWLRDNDYDANELGVDRLTPYLAGGMNLLAFRLTKGNDSGSIRPVILSFGRGNPSIPIRPTAVAATDDMGVMVWVLGPERAVPVNYMSLELNEALINWINPGSTYGDVVTRAANEAGGQGFVTEFAGRAEPFADSVYPPWVRANVDRLRDESGWEGFEGARLVDAISIIGRFDGFRDVARETIPLPEGVTLDELLGCPPCWSHLFSGVADIPEFEPAAFIAAFERHVVRPLEDTRALFEGRNYMTRFYTTMSAHEMTRDPIFDFNPDLDDYSNQHTAEQVIICSPEVTRSAAPWIVTLDAGDRVRGAGRTWPFDADRDEQPANRMIRRIGPEGNGEVVEDNRGVIQNRLRVHNRVQTRTRSAMGCSVSPGPTSGPIALLSLLAIGLVGALRRRRNLG